MKKSSDKFSSISSKIKFISGIISWVILVILVVIAMFLLYYFVAAKIYAQKGEEYKPAFALYTILSPSMVPNIKVYDVIVDVNVKSPQDIQVGDVITFRSTSSMTKDMIITHRVVQVKEENGEYSYVTKGDANLSPDASPAPYKNVQGKVLFHIPQLGRVQEFLGTKGGWLLVVVLPALYVIISDILKIARLKTVKNEVHHYENNLSLEQAKEEEKKKETEQKLMERYGVERTSKDEGIIDSPSVVDNSSDSNPDDDIVPIIQENLDSPLLLQEDVSSNEEEVEPPKLRENSENDDEVVDESPEVSEESEVVVVRGETLEKPKKKRKRKRKRKHHNHGDQTLN